MSFNPSFWFPGLEQKNNYGLSSKITKILSGVIKFAISQTDEKVGYTQKQENDIPSNILKLNSKKLVTTSPTNLGFPQNENSLKIGFSQEYDLKVNENE